MTDDDKVVCEILDRLSGRHSFPLNNAVEWKVPVGPGDEKKAPIQIVTWDMEHKHFIIGVQVPNHGKFGAHVHMDGRSMLDALIAEFPYVGKLLAQPWK